jgi:hypothetical protein
LISLFVAPSPKWDMLSYLIASLLAATEIVKPEAHSAPTDEEIAQISAEFGHKYNLSMGDSVIAAPAMALKAVCITDDPYLKQV